MIKYILIILIAAQICSGGNKKSGNSIFGALKINIHSSVLSNAEKWNGRHYKRGVGSRCGDWVGYVVRKSGKNPPTGYLRADSWLKYGRKVSLATIRKGDVVIYSRKNGHGHVAIYAGNGRVIHRSTRSKPVGYMNLHYRRILGVRRG